MTRPRLDLYLLASGYLIWQGWALVQSRLATGAVSQLQHLHFTAENLGILFIFCGLLLPFIKSFKIQLAVASVHLILWIAALLLIIHQQAAQSLVVYTTIQIALYVFIVIRDE